MNIRFFHDPDTERPHCESHGVSVEEVSEILEDGDGEEFPGYDGATVSTGRTRGGRYLRVVWRLDEFGEDEDDVWVITAYPLTAKQLKALKRRRGRKG